MSGMAAKMVTQYFESKELKMTEDKENGLHVCWVLNKGENIDIYFSFDDSDSHVSLEGGNFIKLPKSAFESLELYKLVNECNKKYTHVKFTVNADARQILVRDDDVIQLDSCGSECYELMMRMLNIVEDAYPSLMKLILDL